MNSKRTITGLATAAMLLAFSATASAATYDYAKVVSAKPIIRYVTVRTPVQECWQDTQYYTRYEPRHNSAGRTLAGALIGGVIGHQFGSGRGNDAATIAGAMIGASAARGPVQRVEYARPIERCETRYRSTRQERIDGYDVVYRYKGQNYATRMPYDPGNRIKVRVDIRPAG